MNKKEAIKTVNNYLEIQSLNNQNTHFSNIVTSDSNEKEVWWFNIPQKKFYLDLHLLLNKPEGLIWLKILENTFKNLGNFFLIRTDNEMVDLEISSKNTNYMVDIKSGGTEYNFKKHVEHEF